MLLPVAYACRVGFFLRAITRLARRLSDFSCADHSQRASGQTGPSSDFSCVWNHAACVSLVGFLLRADHAAPAMLVEFLLHRPFAASVCSCRLMVGFFLRVIMRLPRRGSGFPWRRLLERHAPSAGAFSLHSVGPSLLSTHNSLLRSAGNFPPRGSTHSSFRADAARIPPDSPEIPCRFPVLQ